MNIIRTWLWNRRMARAAEDAQAEARDTLARYGVECSRQDLLRQVASQAMRILDAAGMAGAMSDQARRWWVEYRSIEDSYRGMMNASQDMGGGQANASASAELDFRKPTGMPLANGADDGIDEDIQEIKS